MGKVLVVTNRKGGTGKSTASISLGAGLARQGKKVLIIDAGIQNIIKEQEIGPTEGIISHDEGISLMP